MNETLQKITSIWRHIEEVQKNCFILSERLIEAGQDELARQLITNSLVHDQSKFVGIEWEYLHTDDSNMRTFAIRHHQSINPHHPEYWSGIQNMPDVYLAEMACDIKARSSEFGTDLRSWIDDVASHKYGFSKRDKVYKKLKKFVNMICQSPFS